MPNVCLIHVTPQKYLYPEYVKNSIENKNTRLGHITGEYPNGQ